MMSEPMEFCNEMECSGVSNLLLVSSVRRSQAIYCIHGRAIVRTEKAHAFFCDLCKL